jgi:signal transduction histidine kinase
MRRRTITLRPQALAKGLTLDAEIDAASQDALVGDPTRVRQILLNLLSNAIKFTDQGGVRVHASTIDQPVCADDLESRSAVGGCLSSGGLEAGH